MPRANWDFIGSLKIPVPGIDTQSIIIDYLDRETARIDELVSEKERMLDLLEEKQAAPCQSSCNPWPQSRCSHEGLRDSIG